MNTISLNSSFTDQLSGDLENSNYSRQVFNACYSWVMPKPTAFSKLIMYSSDVAKELKIEESFCKSTDFAEMMTGNRLFPGSKPYAMCYGGHQFGTWAGQLGDGRAINLGEADMGYGHMNLQLKGAGPTPYSRTADGFAVLRSSVREFLCSEAMHYLNVPTTRSLSITLTGEMVLRDIMYNGNPAFEKGAVVCRVAPSFIRFGNFEILASRNDLSNLKNLFDYSIEHYFPNIENNKNKYLECFKEIAERTCDLIVHWQRVGFVHGVMNTDNMSILGLTIDYGPFGWIDDFNTDWTPNTTDMPGKRYRFGNQPMIAQWNLLKLANALFPIIRDEVGMTEIIDNFKTEYYNRYQEMMHHKLGLFNNLSEDTILISGLEEVFKISEIDMTIFFRNLSKTDRNFDSDSLLKNVKPAFYQESLSPESLKSIMNWMMMYRDRLNFEDTSFDEKKKKMDLVNPKYVLRNYMAQMAIDELEKGRDELIYELYDMLKNPYDEQPKYENWFAKRPDWAREKIGCSMLSCSS